MTPCTGLTAVSMAPAVVHRTGRPVALTHFFALLTPVAGAFRVPSTAPPVILPTAFPVLPPISPEIVSAITAVLNNPATIHDNQVNFFIIHTPNIFY